jgi:folate-binding protein YgfZ
MSTSEATGLHSADLDRDVIDVSGPDALSFLHSQMANDINDIAVGETVHSLLLEPTGHLVALVRIVRHRDDALTIDVERGYGEVVVKRLSKFILRAKVVMSVGTKVVRAFRGNNAREILRGATSSSCALAQPWWDDANAIDVIGDIADIPAIGLLSDMKTVDAIRVDAGWPRLGVDIEAGDIPAATGVVAAAVSFTKGCYPGQELVERMDSRGTVAPVVLRVFSNVDEVSEADVTSRGSKYVFARVKRGELRGEELQALWH